MLFKSDPHRMLKIGNQNLMQLIYATKASWDQARETERAVYESHVDSELSERTKLQECKYMYLYQKARRRHAHGHLNDGVIQH
ncbi:YaaL family protein [Limosilactobacillus caecicola]|uniref:YaaL family protein n=1 Tax=Limosilactobacillus caecicola TaxID=2941332 RepID=UPI00203B44D4|nr:YaaL family protein [Limosilactobacillus caecicola]